MSLDLGELVGSLRMDVLPWSQALGKADADLVTFASGTKATGKRAGDDATAGLAQGAAGLSSEAKSAGAGASAALATGLAGMDAEARAAGSSAVAGLGAALDGAAAEAKAAGSAAGKGFSDEFKQGAKNAGAAAGAGAGVALSAGVLDNISVEAGLNKVGVQLGLGKEGIRVAGQVAGDIYANNFGEDLPQINEAIGNVVKNMNIKVRDADLQPITEQVLNLTTAFDQDLGMTTAAVGQMIRTGMVKDAQEGLDILTVGLQSPANKADDLMETMNEYGTQFRNLGLDGKDAMGLLSQGLQGGARDADIVADAMKEFSLKTQGELLKTTQTIDGPKASLTALGEAFRAAGYDAMDGNKGFKLAHQIQADIAAGGPKAKKGLQAMLEGLRDTKDPLEQSRNAVALFGTQAEDMGDALYSLDLDKTAGELGKVEGASQAAVDQMGTGAQATIDTYKRKLIDMGRSAIESTGPSAALAGAVAAFGPAVLQVVGPVATLVAARAMQATAAGTAATAETVASGAVVRGWLMSAAASTAGALKMAASWVIAMGPIAIAIALVVGLVVLIVKNWDTIKEKTGEAWNWVVDKIKGVPDALGGVAGKLKQKGKDFLQGLKDGASDKWEDAKRWFSGIPEKTTSAVGGVVNTLKSKGKDLLQGVKDGAVEKWEDAKAWFGSVPEKSTNAVGGVLTTLKQKGRDLLGGLKDGATEKWEDAKTWITSIPEKVTTALGNLGTLLKSAGVAIIQGLIDGITEKFESLKDKVGAITKWVKDNKGPKAYDLTLWRGPGNWIMEGLMNGLDDQMPALKNKVGDVTDSIANAPMPRLMAAVAPNIPESVEVSTYATRQGSAPGGNVTQHIYETTNAQATAAESARRLALAGAGA